MANVAQQHPGSGSGSDLDAEPRVQSSPVQIALTQQFLHPALAELEAFFLAVRHAVDAELQPRQPVKLGKPYPLGQCLEISLSVQKLLRHVDAANLHLDATAARGCAAFKGFLQAGGEFRRVWGDLRESYFQNAFQLGTLYVDVSNDTVTPTKPKVEILPFEEARLVAIRDYLHFIQIASRYWKDEIHPNHVLPELAPYCPLVHVSATGRIALGETTHYMVRMTRTQEFWPSEAVLSQAPMPLALFQEIRSLLAGEHTLNIANIANTPEEGRLQALQHCGEYRDKRWHASHQQTARVLRHVANVNRHLAGDKTYDADTLSADARAQIANIQFVDQELSRLQARLATLQTARSAYVSALQAALAQTN